MEKEPEGVGNDPGQNEDAHGRQGPEGAHAVPETVEARGRAGGFRLGRRGRACHQSATMTKPERPGMRKDQRQPRDRVTAATNGGQRM